MNRLYVAFLAGWIALSSALTGAEPGAAPYTVRLDILSKGFDKITCWVHPRAGTIPGKTPIVVLTMQKLLLTGSDVFYELNEMRTDDLGKSWRGPTPHTETLGRRPEPRDVTVNVCDFTPKWHAASGKLLGTGQTVRYLDNKVMSNRKRETAFSVYDPAARTWTPWTALKMPAEEKFDNAGAGSVQRFDLPNGEIFLPIYFQNPGKKNYSTTVLRCAFDGKELTYREHGTEMSNDIDRGLYEPSLTKYGERYYLTLRNDRAGYVTTSEDGLHYEPVKKWTFDDGSDLGNYNTQQHWVTHSDALYLVYTRKGASNDHVFRHRAPLFMAQVDPEKLRVIRSTERILIRENGARLGNFAITEVNERETWVTVAEWMQPVGCEKYGSDNRVFAARILWKNPNRDWNKR